MRRASRWLGRLGDQLRHEQTSASGVAGQTAGIGGKRAREQDKGGERFETVRQRCERCEEESKVWRYGARERQRVRVEVWIVEVRASAPLLV
jgi:hypothetical protein